MNPQALLKIARQEVGVSKHIHLSHLNAPNIFEGSNGEVGCVIKLQGIAFDTQLNQDINSAKRAWHQALCQISDQYRVMVCLTRVKTHAALTGKFSDAFSEEINRQYHAQFQGQPLYQNQITLTLTHRGFSRQDASKNFLLGFSKKYLTKAKSLFRENSILSLQKTAQQLMASLSRFGPEAAGLNDQNLGHSELLEILSQPFNALKNFAYSNPVLNQKNYYLSLYPQGNLSTYLPRMRLFFGEAIQFESPGEGVFYAKCLSIKEYGTETAPTVLDSLLNLDCEFLQTHAFAIEPSDQAQKLISRQIIKLENSNDPAKSQIQALSQLRDDLASGHVKTGFYQHTLMLISEDLNHLNTQITEAVKRYGQAGLVAIEESIGLEPAFWSQLPMNAHYVIRAQPITSANFVDFCPLHNYRTGYRDKNHLGSAVTLMQTPSRTPLFFNYHTAGSGKPNDLTPGHTTIIGGNGSGKTVFLGLMDAQMGRYGGQSFIFDRDHGLEIYVRATGGTYLSITPPTDHSLLQTQTQTKTHSQSNVIFLNPFQLSDSPENRLFLKTWLSQLTQEEHESSLPSEINIQLSECIDYAYDMIPAEHRQLSTALQWLPVNFPRWNRLYQWTQAQGIRQAGEYAYLFDHPKDALSLNSSKIGFDLTHLMTQPKSVLTAVLMYLFRRIEEILSGQRVSILLDEGWMYLDNPYWQSRLKQWLPTLRKKNCHIVLATQSPESIVSNPISSVFFDNCASNIFFCNEKANFEKHYSHFNISESEFEFIKNTPREQRLFLYKQNQDSAVCQLNLSHMEDCLAVFSGNTQTVQLLNQIRDEIGDNPKDWLPVFHARRKNKIQEKNKEKNKEKNWEKNWEKNHE